MGNDAKDSTADATAALEAVDDEEGSVHSPSTPSPFLENGQQKTVVESSSDGGGPQNARAENLEALLGSPGEDGAFSEGREWIGLGLRPFPSGASRWPADDEPLGGAELQGEPENNEGDADWGLDLDASALDWDDGAPAPIHAPRTARNRRSSSRPGGLTGAVRRRKSAPAQAPAEPASFLLTPQRLAEEPRGEPARSTNDAPLRKDPLSEAARSSLMGKVKSQKTKPELELKAALRAVGLTNYRLASGKLPGKPDISFGGARVAVFVDGCFWHGCSQCYRKPEGNGEYWAEKKERNMARDIRVNSDLEAIGWLSVRFWEHELRGDGARDAAEKIQLLVGQRLAEADAAKKEKADHRAALLSAEPSIQ